MEKLSGVGKGIPPNLLVPLVCNAVAAAEAGWKRRLLSGNANANRLLTAKTRRIEDPANSYRRTQSRSLPPRTQLHLLFVPGGGSGSRQGRAPPTPLLSDKAEVNPSLLQEVLMGPLLGNLRQNNRNLHFGLSSYLSIYVSYRNSKAASFVYKAFDFTFPWSKTMMRSAVEIVLSRCLLTNVK